jgi:hypothetical protein
MLQYNITNSIERKFSTPIAYIIIGYFWFCNFFGSMNYVAESSDVGLDPTIALFLNKALLGFFFSPKDFAILFLSLFPVIGIKSKLNLSGKWLLLFLFALGTTILSFSNPYSVYGSLSKVFSNGNRSALLFLLSLYVFLALDPVVLTIYLKRIFKIGIISFALYSSFYFISFLFLRGIFYINIQRVLVQHDQLIWIYFLGMILVILRFINKKIRYLFLIIYFSLVIILSFVRTPFWMVIYSLLIIWIFLIGRTRQFSRFSFIAFFIFISSLLAIIIIQDVVGLKAEVYVDRYLGAFSYFTPGTSSESYATDQGHLTESLATSEYFLKNLNIFWGGGMNNEPNLVPGATNGRSIHNMYVYVWAQYGIFFTVFLVYIILLLIGQIIIHLSKFYGNNGAMIDFFKFGISVSLLVFFLSSWASSLVRTINTDLLAISQFVLFISLLRIDRNIFNNFITQKRSPS